jgi:hypothetical protein
MLEDSVPRRGKLAMRMFAAGVCLAILGVCWSAVEPVRVLPEHIRRIYIREFKNYSRQYGAQAPLTLKVNDEFMLDGRLDVVQNRRADVRLEGVIRKFKEYAVAGTGDRFPLISAMEMICVVELWDPYDTDRIVPIGRWTVTASVHFESDPRRSTSETQTEARERLYEQMAKNIVDAVLTKKSEPPKTREQNAMKKYKERHSPERFEPVAPKPRYPKPTPYGKKKN